MLVQLVDGTFGDGPVSGSLDHTPPPWSCMIVRAQRTGLRRVEISSKSSKIKGLRVVLGLDAGRTKQIRIITSCRQRQQRFENQRMKHEKRFLRWVRIRTQNKDTIQYRFESGQIPLDIVFTNQLSQSTRECNVCTKKRSSMKESAVPSVTSQYRIYSIRSRWAAIDWISSRCTLRQ